MKEKEKISIILGRSLITKDCIDYYLLNREDLRTIMKLHKEV